MILDDLVLNVSEFIN